MRSTLNRFLPLSLAIVAIGMMLVPAARAQERVNETRPAAADGTVRVNNLAGSVRVTGWARNEVQVQGTLGKDVERLDFTSEGGRVEIKVVLPETERGRNRRIEASSELEIRVPAGSRVSVRTISADISVQQITGDLTLNSVSGSIEMPGKSGRIAAETISGDVTVDDNAGPLKINAVSGRVSVRNSTGRVEVSTISGGIGVTAHALSDGDLQSLSGNVSLEADLTPEANLEMVSHSGTVDVYLPSGVSAAFRAESFSGSINNDFGPKAERTRQWGPGYELTFTNGEGGAHVTIKTFSGTVNIKKK